MSAVLAGIFPFESTSHLHRIGAMPENPRAMNHMDPDTKAVHCRLEVWGRWARDAHLRAWPEVTLLGKVIEEGPHGAFCAGQAVVQMPDAIAQVDAAVARLGEVDRRVVCKYYLEWAAPEVLARLLGMRVREFQSVLRRARWRIGGYLSAMEG